MKIKFLLFLLLTITASGFALAAGPQKHVKWTMTIKMATDTEGTVIVKARPEQGWHMYGFDIPEGGPVSTTLDMSASTGVTFTSKVSATPKATSHYDSVLGLDLTWWESAVTFKRNFKVTKPANAKIVCNVRYMACSGASCTPPTKETLSKPVVIKK